MGVGPVRPDLVREWCGTGATNVVQPGNTQIDQGWAPGQKPPSSYENWFNQKVDRYLRYLEWRNVILRPVVIEDFVYAVNQSYSPVGGNYGATLYPRWLAAGDTPAQIGTYLEGPGFSPPFNDDIGALAMSTFKTIPTHFNELRTQVRGIFGRDLFLEYIWKEYTRGETGTAIEFGFFCPSGTRATHLGPNLGFYWTGPSGSIGLHWWPSGAAVATQVSLGVAPPTSGMHKLTLECRGPTMAAYYDDVLKVSAPYRPFDDGPSHNQQVGVRLFAPSMVNYYSAALDRIELWVARSSGYGPSV